MLIRYSLFLRHNFDFLSEAAVAVVAPAPVHAPAVVAPEVVDEVAAG